MWKTGIVGFEDKKYKYEVKVYDEGSEFGIDGGRIVKLEIRCAGETVAHYSRGWDIEPKDKGAEVVLINLINDYN